MEQSRNLEWYRRIRPVEPPMKAEPLEPDSIQAPKPRTLNEVLLSALAEMTPEEKLFAATSWLQPQAKAATAVAGMTRIRLLWRTLQGLTKYLAEYVRQGKIPAYVPKGAAKAVLSSLFVDAKALRAVSDVEVAELPGRTAATMTRGLMSEQGKIRLDPYKAKFTSLPHEMTHIVQEYWPSISNDLTEGEKLFHDALRKYMHQMEVVKRELGFIDPEAAWAFYQKMPTEEQARFLADKIVERGFNNISSSYKPRSMMNTLMTLGEQNHRPLMQLARYHVDPVDRRIAEDAWAEALLLAKRHLKP